MNTTHERDVIFAFGRSYNGIIIDLEWECLDLRTVDFVCGVPTGSEIETTCNIS